MSLPNEVTDATFETELLSNKNPVVVFFYASWCGPCLIMLPIITELIKERHPEFEIRIIDIDSCPNAVKMSKIQTIPKYLLFRNGHFETVAKGTMSKKALLEAIKSRLGPL